MSDKAYREAGKHLSAPLVDAGIHRLKNIDELVHIWTWEPEGGTHGSEAGKASDLPAQYRTAIVGVLPFANLAGSADEYFADGLTEDLIHALSLQSFYRVLSRSSTFAFKGKNLTTRLIAREIDATYLIQGSVRRAGSKIRVTAELIAPENGEQLWAGRYDRDIGDLFALQDELTTSLSAALAPEIFRAEASAPSRATSTDLTAWDRFLRGLSHYYQQTKPDFEASIALFREAIALDPALDRTRLSRHHHGAGRSIRLDQSTGVSWSRPWNWPRARSGSIRARHSPSRSCPISTVIGQLRRSKGNRDEGRRAQPL